MLLDWRGRRDGKAALCDAGARIERAVARVIADPATRTPDIGGTLGTDTFTAAVVRALSQPAEA